MAGLLTFGVVVSSATAQALKNRDVEGVLFYKEHAFTDSVTGAWPIEYRSAASNGQIILVTTREGRRVRALLGQVPDMIPYPGRGGITQDEALVLCDIAILRYPQHRPLLTNIRRAWKQVSEADYERYASTSQMRQNAMNGVIDNMVAESDRIRAQMEANPSVPFTSLLDKPSTASPAPESKGGQQPEAAEDPDQTLKALQDYYQQLLEVGVSK